MSIKIKDMIKNFKVDATYIAKISGINRVKGIHPIKDDKGQIESVAIMCTINGESYPNEWIKEEKILKYYFYGIKVAGEKRFSTEYEDNKAIIYARNNYPIYAFVREDKKNKFQFKGEYVLLETGEDKDGAMYFILNKRDNLGVKISDLPVQDNDNFPEGKEKERLHKYKERNPKVIKEAKDRFKKVTGKLYCEACGFDFEKVYGKIGKDYIEGHHTKQISDLREEDITNVNDIMLVCANCHRILHKRRPCLSKEEIKELLVNR